MWPLQLREAGSAGGAVTARKTKELKIVGGTERPDRPAPETPRSPEGQTAPNPPGWLDRYGRAKWRELVPELASRRMLTGDALSLLELLCEAWADFRRAQAVLRAGGASYEAATEAKTTLHRKRPEVDQARAARKEYASLLAQFSARIAGVVPDQHRDPMDEHLERRPRGRRSAAS
jgi:P27 family predicted phage terminase small subunit